MPRVELAKILMIGATGLLSSSGLHAQPTRPPPSREQMAQMQAKREAFCTGIRQLGALSKTNFRSIDKGFKPGSDVFRASAITLPDATDCYISTIKGETDHSCSFPARVETLAAQTRGMSNLVARCVGAPPPAVMTDEIGTSSQMLVDGVRYAVQSDDFGDGSVSVTVNVQQWNKPLPR
jgi:hypothetical protein